MFRIPVVIPCRWMTGIQVALDNIGIEINTNEAIHKNVHFMHIDSLYEFIDESDGKTRTAINCGPKEYVSDLSINEIEELIILSPE